MTNNFNLLIKLLGTSLLAKGSLLVCKAQILKSCLLVLVYFINILFYI